MQKEVTIKQGYKNIPHIGIIPENWEVKKLGDIGEFKTSSVDKIIVEGEKIVNLLNYMDVYKNRLINNKINFVKTSVNDRQLETSNLNKGDILFTPSSETTDDIGHSAVVEYDLIDTVYSYHLMRFRLYDQEILDNTFRGYVFNNTIIKKEFSKRATGSTRFTLGKKDFEDSIFAYPNNIQEQQKIAQILKTSDSQIDITKDIIKNIELRNIGLQQQLLTGNRRLDGFSGRFEKLSSGDIFKSISIKNNEGEELLSSTQDKGIVLRSSLNGRVTMPATGVLGYKLVVPGDFVISLRSFQGGLEYSTYRGLVSPAYTILEPKIEIDDEYFKYYFKSHDFIGHLAIAVIGIRDGKNISYSDFCTIKIPYPELEEQKAIANVLNKATEQLDFYKNKLEKLELEKKGLMQQLLTGKIRVKI